MLDKQRLRTFVLGGAVGAILGILLAPRSGRELRGSIADKAGEARERGRETYFEAQEQMRDRLAEVREGPRERPTSVDLGGSSEKTRASRPYLRDVSRDVAGVDAADEIPEVERSEELRRKVKETRERLRGREHGEPGGER